MYAKVFAQIYDGTLCTKGPWQALVTFQQMLILADQDGNVDMTVSAISRRTTIPQEIISLGIIELLKEDPESRTPTEGGRRIIPLSEGRTWGWHVVNYKHYRALKREEDRREYHRDYWHKRKANSTETQTTQHTQPNQPIAEAEAEAKEDKTRSRASSASRPDSVSPQAWKDWIAVRKAKRAGPITETVMSAMQREAIIANITLCKAIEIAAERGWQAFKADWVKARPTQQDIARSTVPSVVGKDPALQKIEEDEKRAIPIPASIREKLAVLKLGS